MIKSKLHPFVSNVILVGSGAAFAQGLTLIFSPLVTRIYSPEVFGLQGVFLSLVGALSPLIALRYPMAVVTARSNHEARQVQNLSIRITIVISILIMAFILAFGGNILEILNAEDLGALLYLLPLALIGVAFQDTASFYLSRRGKFRKLAAVDTLHSFLVNVSRVGAGVITPLTATLVVISAIAPALKAAMLSSLRKGRKDSYGRKTKGLMRTAIRFRDYPLFRMPTDLINELSQAIPIFFLSALYSPAAAGFYVLTRGVMYLPLNLIGSSLGNVAFARFSELARARQRLEPILIKTTLPLLALAPVLVGISWFAPTIFSIAFGDRWVEAGIYAQWVSIWVAAGITGVPAVRMAPVISAQKMLLASSVLILVGRVFAIFVTYEMGGGAVEAVAVFSLFGAVANAFLIIAMWELTRRFDKDNSTLSAMLPDDGPDNGGLQ